MEASKTTKKTIKVSEYTQKELKKFVVNCAVKTTMDQVADSAIILHLSGMGHKFSKQVKKK